jgi:hypothetical protein
MPSSEMHFSRGQPPLNRREVLGAAVSVAAALLGYTALPALREGPVGRAVNRFAFPPPQLDAYGLPTLTRPTEGAVAEMLGATARPGPYCDSRGNYSPQLPKSCIDTMLWLTLSDPQSIRGQYAKSRDKAFWPLCRLLEWRDCSPQDRPLPRPDESPETMNASAYAYQRVRAYLRDPQSAAVADSWLHDNKRGPDVLLSLLADAYLSPCYLRMPYPAARGYFYEPEMGDILGKILYDGAAHPGARSVALTVLLNWLASPDPELRGFASVKTLPMIASGVDFELDMWGFPRIGGINRAVANSELEQSGLIRSPLASAAGKSVPFCVTTEGLEALAAVGAVFSDHAPITPEHRLAPPESVRDILVASCPGGRGVYPVIECIVIELASRERWGPELRGLLLPRLEEAPSNEASGDRYEIRDKLKCCLQALYPYIKTLILAGDERDIYSLPSELFVDNWSPGFTSPEKYEAWKAGVLDGSRTKQLARGDAPFGLRELEALARMHDAVEETLARLYPEDLSQYGSFGSAAASRPSMRQAGRDDEAERFLREETKDWNLRDTIRWITGAIGCCASDPAVKARALEMVAGWN